jgi:hypothetical protein
VTAPGGAFGAGERDNEADPPPADARAPEQPGWSPPWDPPASSPAADHPPPTFPPPNYPPGYPLDYPAGYPEPFPPVGYGGAPYPPPQFGAPAAGYGPPSFPGGYYPAPDYLGGWGPSQEASQPGMNGLAVASLIASFTGLLCCVGSIVAIVLGTIALDQIKRTRQGGYALAVAGIVLGVVGLLVYLIVALFALRSR